MNRYRNKRLHDGERENFKLRHKTHFESKHTRCRSATYFTLHKGSIFS